MKAINLIVVLILFYQCVVCQEKQIPFFPEAQINAIDKSFAKKSELFTSYQDFEEAKLFKISADQYSVEIYYFQNDTIYKERRILTTQEKDDFLDELKKQMVLAGTAAIQKPDKGSSTDSLGIPGKENKTGSETVILDQKGRSGLLITSTITGLGFYAYATPLALDVKGTKEFIGTYMLVGGASFLLPYYATRNKDVTMSQLSMTFYGQTRGIANGILLANLIHAAPVFENEYTGNDYETDWEEYQDKQEIHERIVWGLGVLGSIGEGFAGYKLAHKWDYSVGSASVLQMWGDAGLLSGILVSDVCGFTEPSTRSNDMKMMGTMLTTSAAGLVTGKFFGDSRNYTVGDAIFYRSTLALGTFIPVVLVNYFEPDQTTPYTASMLVGGLAASYAGWRMLKDKDFSTSQGVIITLGELSGALLGLGTGYLLSNDFNSQVILTTTAIGAITGYGLFYYKFKDKALVSFDKVKFNLNLNPAGLFSLNKSYIPVNTYNPFYNNYLVNMRLTF